MAKDRLGEFVRSDLTLLTCDQPTSKEHNMTPEQVVRISDGYRPRTIRCLGLWHFDQWRLKAYTISPAGVEPSQDLIEAARALAEDRIAESAGSG